MIEGRQLADGGTIADRMKEGPKPTNIKEALEKEIETWEIVMQAYKDEEKETPTYPQMYAMKGSIILLQEYLNSLNKLKKFTDKESEGIADPSNTDQSTTTNQEDKGEVEKE